MRTQLSRSGLAVVLSVTATGAMRPCLGQDFEIRTVASRPDAVSGGDALVRLGAPAGSRWTVELDGRDVTSSFRSTGGPTEQLALLTGLQLGKNVITIRSDGRIRSTVELENHPRAGPIFSGPHQTP